MGKMKKSKIALSLILSLALLVGQAASITAFSYAQDTVSEQENDGGGLGAGSDDPSVDSNNGASRPEENGEQLEEEETEGDGNNQPEGNTEGTEQGEEEKDEIVNDNEKDEAPGTTEQPSVSGNGNEEETAGGEAPEPPENLLPPILEDMMELEPYQELIELLRTANDGTPVDIKFYEEYTSSPAFYVEDAEGLKKVAALVNEGRENFDGKTITISGSGIDLSTEKNWIPIGSGSDFPQFCGIFDGNGKTIRNLTIECTEDTANIYEYGAGLFGDISNAEIRNLELKDVDIIFGQNALEAEYRAKGALVSYAYNTCVIENVIVSGRIKDDRAASLENDSSAPGEDMVTGGIVGGAAVDSKLTIANCESNVKIYSATNYTGGILGAFLGSDLEIENCANKGNVGDPLFKDGGDATGHYMASAYGGILGYSSGRTKISKCENSGAVSTGFGYGGGILGQFNNDIEISYCYNQGDVYAYQYAGGVTGGKDSSGSGCSVNISFSQNTGGVTVDDSGNLVGGAGGIAGLLYDCRGSLNNCFSTGTIVGTEFGSSPPRISGIGNLPYVDKNFDVQNCFNGGSLQSESDGSLSAIAYGVSCVSCYYVDTITGPLTDNLSAVAKSTETFASGEVAWLLNSAGGTAVNSGNWGQDGAAPVFADGAHPAVCRVSLEKDGEGTLKFNGSEDSFHYITESEGKDLTVTADPGEGFILKLLTLKELVSGAEIESERSGNSFSFRHQRKDIVASAAFERRPDDAGELNIIWDLGGGTLSDSAVTPATVPYGKTLAEPEITKEGFVLRGWYAVTENEDGTETEARYNFKAAVTTDIMLRAKWVKDSLTVTFDFDDAQGDVPARQTTTTFAIGGSFAAPQATRSAVDCMEYQFKGWFTEKNGGGTQWEDGRKIGEADRGEIVLYADWDSFDLFDSGTLGNPPFVIEDADTLALLAQRVNTGGGKNQNGYKACRFKLGRDIDLSEYESWTPIGTAAHPFRGGLDGDYHTISNLKINAPESDYQGLFGYVTAANGNAVNNIYLEKVDITGRKYVGAVMGYGENLGQSIGANQRLGVLSGSVKGTECVGGVAGAIATTSDYSGLSYTYAFWLNGAAVTAIEGTAGGGAGSLAASSRLTDSCNTGTVAGAAGSGAIAGSGTVSGCWYLENSVTDPADAKGLTALNQVDVASNRAAWLMDQGDKQSRSANWSAKNGRILFAGGDRGAVYRMNLAAADHGSVRLIDDEEGQSLFRAAGSKVAVEATPEQGYLLKTLGVTALRSGGTVAVDGMQSSGGAMSFIMPKDDVLVSPQFTAEGAGQIEVVYKLDGGRWPSGFDAPANHANFGEVLSRPEQDPERTGYVFAGWYSESGEVYTFSEAVTEALTLTAKWKREGNYLVTFNLNLDAASRDILMGQMSAEEKLALEQEVVSAGAVTMPVRPAAGQWVQGEETAYSFLYWSTEPVGGSQWNTRTELTQDTVLYAQWKEIDAMSAGTREQPYEIASLDILKLLASKVNEGSAYSGCWFRLAVSLELGGENWTPIGTAGSPFSGTFLGNDETISGLTIDTGENYVGLFGCTSNAVVQDLKLTGISVNGGQYTGGLTGKATATTIENVSISGTVEGADYTGGLVGCADGSNVGASSRTSSIRNSSMSGSVSGGTNTGGLIGSLQGGSLTDCVNDAEVSGERSNTGGIAGAVRYHEYKDTSGNLCAAKFTLSRCTNNGNVTGSGDCAGGIAGEICHGTTIDKCVNTANIQSGNYVGGLFGRVSTKEDDSNKFQQTALTIRSGYNTGSVSGTDYVGGLVGAQESRKGSGQNSAADGTTIENCFSSGTASGNGPRVGALSGHGFGKDTTTKECCARNDGTVYVDADSAALLLAEDFRSGRAAYLLDGGSGSRKALWAQGVSGPVFADGDNRPVYEIQLAQSGAGTVSGAGIQTGYNYLSLTTNTGIEAVPEEGSVVSLFEVADAAGTVVNTQTGNRIEYTIEPEKSLYIRVNFAETQTGNCTVRFHTNGGTIAMGGTDYPELYSTTAAFGTKGTAVLPADPQKAGSTFKGWYEDKELTVAFNAKALITADLDLYARYSGNVAVQFDLNGAPAELATNAAIAAMRPSVSVSPTPGTIPDPGTPVWPDETSSGRKVVHTFLGWYSGNSKWDFSTKLSAGYEGQTLVLTAKWRTEIVLNEEDFENITDQSVLEILAKNMEEGVSYIGKTLTLAESFEVTDWSKPIGGKTPFEGTLDGQGKTITMGSGCTAPLFARIDGTLKNVSLSGTIQAAGAAEYFGGLAQEVNGQLIECSLKGMEIIGGNAGSVGGLAGYVTGRLKGCSTDSASSVSGSSAAGGIAGTVSLLTAQISDCENNAEVCGGTYAGGIAGQSAGSVSSGSWQTISGCANSGAIMAENGAAGGLFGSIGWRVVLEDGANEGAITGQTAGGVIGVWSFTFASGSARMENCINSGMVTGRENAGGLAGHGVSGGTVIEKCGNTADVTVNGGAGRYAGGLVGSTRAPSCSFIHSYNAGKISGPNTSGMTTGLNSDANISVESCYTYHTENPGMTMASSYGTCTVEKSYYLKPDPTALSRMASFFGLDSGGEESTEVTTPEQPAEAFASGRVAYLLDGGDDEHERVWTQGRDHPELLADHSVYRISTDSHTRVAGEDIAYRVIGTNVDVSVSVPSSDKDGVKMVLKSLVVKHKTKGEEDITETRSFTVRESNASVKATFGEEEEEPPAEKPNDPDKDHGGSGSGGGNGNGSGTGVGDGNGAGSDDHGDAGQGGGTGTGTGTGAGGGENQGSAGADDQTTVTDPTYTSTQSTGDPAENLLAAEQAEENQTESDDEAAMEASGGATEGGSGSGEEEQKEEQKLSVFAIVKQTVVENPLISLVLALVVIGLLLAAGLRRYRRNKGGN
ncbi:InlB B-repeat-containing protein [Bacilliculturomica massiliensis]|uniref:InlB B-repeat-containing protein n=1 Tax=Bacilliculturomica massiliensis TaxID=1917867 RepID=UPI0010320702|nr:InlB B-repeat-containing protein [Bacilliculturomica massiliensis]